MSLDNLNDLYVEQLKDLYSAETQILKALPQMAQTASHPKLRDAFEHHERQTQEHMRRLERILDDLGESPRGHHCQGMEGVIKEGKEMMQQPGDADVKDAGLIAAAQRVEHYEMAGYGTVRTYADRLGHRDHADLLQRTLDEEGDTDHLLTRIAEQVVNADAMH